MRNLSQAATLIHRHVVDEVAIFYDEEGQTLSPLVAGRRWRKTTKAIRKLTGHHPKVVLKVIEDRISPQAFYELGFPSAPVFGTRYR